MQNFLYGLFFCLYDLLFAGFSYFKRSFGEFCLFDEFCLLVPHIEENSLEIYTFNRSALSFCLVFDIIPDIGIIGGTYFFKCGNNSVFQQIGVLKVLLWLNLKQFTDLFAGKAPFMDMPPVCVGFRNEILIEPCCIVAVKSQQSSEKCLSIIGFKVHKKRLYIVGKTQCESSVVIACTVYPLENFPFFTPF